MLLQSQVMIVEFGFFRWGAGGGVHLLVTLLWWSGWL